MRHLLCLFISVFFTLPVWADASYEALLNTVALQFSAEQWVTSKTALVTIGINASVSGNGLDKVQNEVLNKLNQLSNKGEWHLVSFNRNLDQSGLERVQITAQNRLPSGELSNLRDKAKAISIPGETFTVDNIEFTPSAEELRDANAVLRNDIYQQIKAEIANLNKLYGDQNYYLHSANFINEIIAPQPMQMYKTAGVAANAPGVSRNLSVGDKLQITATVVLATAPNLDVIKIIHN